MKVLIGIPRKTHISLAMDEVNGLKNLGHQCTTITYGKNDSDASIPVKILSTIGRSVRLVAKLYAVKPDFLYLNSRFETIGSVRDYITILIIKLTYYRKCKIVVKSHGSDHTVYDKKSFFYQEMVLPFLRKNVDAWLFLSNDEKDLVKEYDEEMASKIFVAPNIIEPSRCLPSDQFKEKFKLPKDKFKILFVGRVVVAKGIFDIMEAIPMSTNLENCVFVFVGDGDDFNELKQQAKDTGVDKYCIFTGFIPDEECDHFYANCDVLVFPTYHTEGFAMALFKSVALGLPVITTNFRAAKDYLVEPENVLWVEKQDPASVAKAINRLFDDKLLQKQMKVNNILVGKRFAAPVVAQNMSDIFQSLQP